MSKSNLIRVQLGIIVILVAVYFVQVATPLRLHPDTIVLLSVAETVEHGGGYLYHGQPTVFPPGYPTLLALLIRAHLAHVWVIVGLNVVFVVIGLLATRYLLLLKGFGDGAVFSVCLLTLLSIVFIKFSAIPLTDLLFFGMSMCCLAVMKYTSSHLTLRGALVSMCLVVVSICVRGVGIALIPAFIWMLVSQRCIQLYIMRQSFRIKAATLVFALSAAVAIACVVHNRSAYFTFLSGRFVVDALVVHLKELGEITLNLQLASVSGKTLPLLGLLVLSLFLLGVWRQKLGVIEIYVVGYSAIILVWPFYDTRFWLPVIPLLISYSGLSLKRLINNQELTSYLLVVYAGMVSMSGLYVMVANTRISFSGPSFADAYTEGFYYSTNCAVWPCKNVHSAKVDLNGLHLLRYYQTK